MASIVKVNAEGVAQWLRHNNRAIRNDRNKDIDRERSPLNETLTPGIDIPKEEQYERREEIWKKEYARYKEMIKDFYCLGRKNLNTLASVVVTKPQEITDPRMEELFFRGVADFLTKRYGNPVSISVHRDEGKHYVMKDEDGKPIMGQDGKPLKEWHAGRSHLHYTFIPTVKIDKEKIMRMKRPRKEMLEYDEKVSAKERINRRDLLTLHKDMNRYINEVCGIKCNLNSGITREIGGNKSVEELKKEFDQQVIKELSVENERLRATVIQQQGEINRLTDVLQERNEEVKELREVVEQKDAVIEELQGRIDMLQDKVNQIEMDADEEIWSKAEEIAKREAEIRRLQEEMERQAEKKVIIEIKADKDVDMDM